MSKRHVVDDELQPKTKSQTCLEERLQVWMCLYGYYITCAWSNHVHHTLCWLFVTVCCAQTQTAPNGPKRPQTAPNGPKRPQLAPNDHKSNQACQCSHLFTHYMHTTSHQTKLDDFLTALVTTYTTVLLGWLGSPGSARLVGLSWLGSPGSARLFGLSWFCSVGWALLVLLVWLDSPGSARLVGLVCLGSPGSARLFGLCMYVCIACVCV